MSKMVFCANDGAVKVYNFLVVVRGFVVNLDTKLILPEADTIVLRKDMALLSRANPSKYLILGALDLSRLFYCDDLMEYTSEVRMTASGLEYLVLSELKFKFRGRGYSANILVPHYDAAPIKIISPEGIEAFIDSLPR